MVVTSLESKTGGDVYGNIKKNIDDSIAVRPWTKEDIIKCGARRHTQKISNNQRIDKEEAGVWLWIFLVAAPIWLGLRSTIGIFLLPHSFFNFSFNICGMQILIFSIFILPAYIYYHSLLPTQSPRRLVCSCHHCLWHRSGKNRGAVGFQEEFSSRCPRRRNNY